MIAQSAREELRELFEDPIDVTWWKIASRLEQWRQDSEEKALFEEIIPEAQQAFERWPERVLRCAPGTWLRPAEDERALSEALLSLTHAPGCYVLQADGLGGLLDTEERTVAFSPASSLGEATPRAAEQLITTLCHARRDWLICTRFELSLRACQHGCVLPQVVELRPLLTIGDAHIPYSAPDALIRVVAERYADELEESQRSPEVFMIETIGQYYPHTQRLPISLRLLDAQAQLEALPPPSGASLDLFCDRLEPSVDLFVHGQEPQGMLHAAIIR